MRDGRGESLSFSRRLLSSSSSFSRFFLFRKRTVKKTHETTTELCSNQSSRSERHKPERLQSRDREIEFDPKSKKFSLALSSFSFPSSPLLALSRALL